MDQVKAALAWLKEHHFWVLSVLVIGVILGVWYSGSSSVAAQYESNKSKIDSEFSSISGIKNQPFKPNERVNREQSKQIAVLAQSVLQEWTELYTTQTEEVLIWPKELPERFRKFVENKRFGDPIPDRLRELYLNYIQESFKPLVAIVDAQPVEGDSRRGRSRSGGSGGEFGGGGGRSGDIQLDENGEPLQTYLVDWVDQGDLRARLELEKVPSDLQIWVLQEDLWVYGTLLEAIAKTNAATGATRRDRAAVQTILEMKVGQTAAGYDASAGRLAIPDTSDSVASSGFGGGEFGGGDFGGGEFGGGGGGEFGGGGGGFGGGGGEFGGEFGGGGGFGSEGGDTTAVLLAGRYLGPEDAPIMEVTPGEYSFGREFKRLPVRLTLEMDTRWLSTLMWELANAPLQVEVDQVRFNPSDVGKGSRRRGGGGNGEVGVFERRPTVGTVVLQGIVYLFNEPEQSIAVTGNDQQE